MSDNDLQRLFHATTEVARWRAEVENANARLQLAKAAEARAHLLSQHDPVARLGINRAALRVLLDFMSHNDISRMNREITDLENSRA